MKKLVIVSGTNRPNSNSLKVANALAEQAKQHWGEVQIVSLESLNGITISAEHFAENGQHDVVRKLQDEVMNPAKDFCFVLPEYNGTFPGIFKYFIDSLSVRDRDATFRGKNVALIGVASGRAGNLRGLDQMNNALNYLGMDNYPQILPLSSIHTYVGDDGKLNQNIVDTLVEFSKGYAAFCK